VVEGAAAESAYNLLANSPAIYVPTEYNDAKSLRLHFMRAQCIARILFYEQGRKKLIQEATRRCSGVKSRLVYMYTLYIMKTFQLDAPALNRYSLHIRV